MKIFPSHDSKSYSLKSLIRKRPLFFQVMIVLLFTATSCSKTEEIIPANVTSKDNEITIDKAKQIYEQYMTQEKTLRSPKRRKRKEHPAWGSGKTLAFQDGKKAMVVSLLEEPEALTLFSFEKDTSTIKSFEEVYTPVKLVIYNDSNGQEKIERMYIKANPTYARKKQYIYDDRDFTGTLWFEDSNDSFSRAYEYENGKIIKTIAPVDNNQTNAKISNCGYEFGLTIVMAIYQVASVQGYGTWGPTYLYSFTFDASYIDYTTCSVSVGNVGPPAEGQWTGSPSDHTNSPFFIQWFNSLNPTEKEWVNNNWTAAGVVFVNYINAETMSRLFYSKKNPSSSEIVYPMSLPDQDGTNQNAFKHIVAAALHTKYLGPSTAWTVVSNHELGTVNNHFRQMDIANNGKGIQLGNECNCTDQQIINAAKNMVNQGQGYRVISGNNPNNGQLFPTSNAANDENF